VDEASIPWKMNHFIADAAITLARLCLKPGSIEYLYPAAAVTNETRFLQ
jgi:hypothetical protein